MTRCVLNLYTECFREEATDIKLQVAVRLHDTNKLDNPKVEKEVGTYVATLNVDEKHENINETHDVVKTVEKGEHVEEVA